MQSATHSPSLIPLSSKEEIPALDVGPAQPGNARPEVAPSQIQLPSNPLMRQHVLLTASDVSLPGSIPEEPQEDTANLRSAVPADSDDEAQQAAVQTDSKHAQTSSQEPAKTSAAGSLPPPREVMTSGEFRTAYSLRFGDGSQECQQCAECCACCGVGVLALSVGVWACHCSHAVPFAITGGSMVGAAYVHAFAKEWGCVPSIHSEKVYQPRRSA